MILTEIGEIGVHHNGVTYILRPSLYAMSKIGSPKEIVQSYALVMENITNQQMQWRQFKEAFLVINCCSEEDLSEVFGYFNDKQKFVQKAATFNEILCIARSLLRHGITGTQTPSKKKEQEQRSYTSEFKCSEHVALAIAHLGMSEQQAWNTTMTTLVDSMQAKFPEPKNKQSGANAPTIEEHDATMEWFEKVQRKRGQKTH